MWHKPVLTVFGATPHISCLSAANSPWVIMKRFSGQKGRERERKREAENEGEVEGGGGG